MLANIAQRIKFYKLPILSGILIGTSYAPLPPWAALFALVPLWLFWLNHSHKIRHILIGGWLTGFLLTIIGFNWVAHTAQEFGHFPAPVAYLVLILYACFANLHIFVAGALWFLFAKYLKPQKNLLILSLPLLSALCQTYLQFLFHWNYGYSFLWVKWPIYQIAEIIGFEGLSYLVMVFNCLLLFAVIENSKSKKLKLFTVAVISFAALNLAGYVLVKSLPEYDAKIRVGIVQANIGNLEKQAAEQGPMFRNHILNTYMRITEDLNNNSEPIDFIVWPETAFPSTIYPGGEGDFHVQQLKQFVAQQNMTLVTGGYGYNSKKDQYTNSMFVIHRGEITDQQYIKTHLLAFGEFIPLASSFPILKRWIPAGNFLAGTGPNAIDVNSLKIGPQICYEGLYPEFSVELARQGADLIVNLTNDSWFGKWQEPFQHLIMTLARGIELRMPVVRSTNTGISTVVLPDGEVLYKTPLHKEAYHSYEIPYFKSRKATIFQLFPWLMDMIFVSLLLLVLIRAYRKSLF